MNFRHTNYLFSRELSLEYNFEQLFHNGFLCEMLGTTEIKNGCQFVFDNP